MLKTSTLLALAIAALGIPALADPQPPVGDLVYVDFPARLDPQGTHKHIPFAHGSRMYVRRQIVAHDIYVNSAGKTEDDSYGVDAESTVTRLPTETLIVEPSGRTLHLKPTVSIDRASEAWRFIVIRRGYPVPAYLANQQPDIDVP